MDRSCVPLIGPRGGHIHQTRLYALTCLALTVLSGAILPDVMGSNVAYPVHTSNSSRFTLTKKALNTLHFPSRKLLFLASSQKGLGAPYETPYICIYILFTPQNFFVAEV